MKNNIATDIFPHCIFDGHIDLSDQQYQLWKGVEILFWDVVWNLICISQKKGPHQKIRDLIDALLSNSLRDCNMGITLTVGRFPQGK